MDENLIKRLESAVARIEMLSSAGVRSACAAEVVEDAMAMDPSIIAFDDLISQYVNTLTSAGEKIGGQVLNISKIIEEAFFAQKELLIKIKRSQVNCRFSFCVVVCIKTLEIIETISSTSENFV